MIKACTYVITTYVFPIYLGERPLLNRSPRAYGLNSSPSSGDSQASDDCDHSPPLPSPSSCGGYLRPSFTMNEVEASSDDVKCSYNFRQQALTDSSEDTKYLSESSMVEPQVCIYNELLLLLCTIFYIPHEIEQPEAGNLKCPTLTQKQSKSKQQDCLRKPFAHLNNHPHQYPKTKVP